MTNRLMRIIDSGLGIPLCLLLSLGAALYRLLFFWRRRRPAPPPRHFFIIKLFGLGSIILASPLFQAIHRRFPGASITLVTFAENRQFAESLAEVQRVLPIRSGHLLQFVADTVRVVLAAWQARPDVTIDLEFFTKFTAMLTFLTASRRRVGFYFRMFDRGTLFTDTITFNTHKHISQNFLAMLIPMGFDDGEQPAETYTLSQPRFPPVDEAALFQRLGLQPPYLVMNPNASGLSFERRWPAHYFVELIRRIRSDYPDLPIALIGGRSEREYVAEIIGMACGPANRVMNLAGQTTLPELAAVLRRSRLFVSNDSGPLHLASLYQVPTIALFGPETPMLYRPLNPRNYSFYRPDLHCSPCLSVYNAKVAQCRGRNLCLQRITPAMVYPKVAEFLAPPEAVP